MIPTHNCAHFLRETLASVLAQDPGPHAMQIEVVDDGSVDDPRAVVEELGRGRVTFFRQPENVGHVRNFDTCLLRSCGELVHLLHGDDRVLPGFYAAMEPAFREDAEIGAAFCRGVFMTERGHWVAFSRIERRDAGVIDNWLDIIAASQRLITPAVVVRRAVYERLGGFDRRLAWSEDWEMWVRIAAHYPVWFEPRVLAEYRMHPASSSGRNARTGENIRDTRRAIRVIRSSLPPADAERLSPRAEAWCADLALDMAKRAVRARDWRTALVQLREGWVTRPSLAQAARIAAFFGWSAGRRLRMGKGEAYLAMLDGK
jgi:glycosyltransferase involved in cell wall biosynthesis